jgi:hypothetical protein
MPDAALIAPSLVSEFMHLERDLHNFEINVIGLREAVSVCEMHRSAIRTAEASGVAGAVDAVTHKCALKEPEKAAGLLHAGAVEMRKDAWRRTTSIVELLRPYLSDIDQEAV